jgi:hypothetical protein
MVDDALSYITEMTMIWIIGDNPEEYYRMYHSNVKAGKKFHIELTCQNPAAPEHDRKFYVSSMTLPQKWRGTERGLWYRALPRAVQKYLCGVGPVDYDLMVENMELVQKSMSTWTPSGGVQSLQQGRSRYIRMLAGTTRMNELLEKYNGRMWRRNELYGYYDDDDVEPRVVSKEGPCKTFQDLYEYLSGVVLFKRCKEMRFRNPRMDRIEGQLPYYFTQYEYGLYRMLIARGGRPVILLRAIAKDNKWMDKARIIAKDPRKTVVISSRYQIRTKEAPDWLVYLRNRIEYKRYVQAKYLGVPESELFAMHLYSMYQDTIQIPDEGPAPWVPRHQDIRWRSNILFTWKAVLKRVIPTLPGAVRRRTLLYLYTSYFSPPAMTRYGKAGGVIVRDRKYQAPQRNISEAEQLERELGLSREPTKILTNGLFRVHPDDYKRKNTSMCSGEVQHMMFRLLSGRLLYLNPDIGYAELGRDCNNLQYCNSTITNAVVKVAKCSLIGCNMREEWVLYKNKGGMTIVMPDTQFPKMLILLKAGMMLIPHPGLQGVVPYKAIPAFNGSFVNRCLGSYRHPSEGASNYNTTVGNIAYDTMGRQVQICKDEGSTYGIAGMKIPSKYLNYVTYKLNKVIKSMNRAEREFTKDEYVETVNNFLKTYAGCLVTNTSNKKLYHAIPVYDERKKKLQLVSGHCGVSKLQERVRQSTEFEKVRARIAASGVLGQNKPCLGYIRKQNGILQTAQLPTKRELFLVSYHGYAAIDNCDNPIGISRATDWCKAGGSTQSSSCRTRPAHFNNMLRVENRPLLVTGNAEPVLREDLCPDFSGEGIPEQVQQPVLGEIAPPIRRGVRPPTGTVGLAATLRRLRDMETRLQ